MIFISMHNNKGQMLSKQPWISAAFLLLLTSIISKAFGFFREILIAKNFGISSQVDAYLVAISIPVLIGGTIGSAFAISIVPLYHKMINNSLKEANDFLKTVFSFTIIVSIALIFTVNFMSEAIIKIIAPSLPVSTMKSAVELTKWLSLLLLGYSLFNVLSSIYNALHHFKIPAFTDMFSNLFIIIALVLLSSLLGIYALVIGVIVSIYFSLLIFVFYLLKQGIVGFNLDFKSNKFKEFIIFIAPVMVFMFFLQISSIVENFFASSLKGGSIAALGYAKRLYDIIPTLIIANIAKAVFPTFSTLFLEQKIDELRDLIVKLNKQFIIYFLPVSFMLIFFRKEIIRVVFMRGAFNELALEMTSGAFMFYAMGLTASTLVPIFFRLCYAFSDTVTPLIAVFSGSVFMCLLNYFLTPVMGITGIALTNSLTVLLTLFVLGIFVRKKLGGLNIKGFAKSFIISFICATLALLPFLKFTNSNPYYFIFLAILYFIFYFILGWFIAKSEFKVVWFSFKRIIMK